MAYLKLAFEKQKLKEGVTPVDFYDHLQGAYAVFLDSSFGGRFSYIVYDPFAVITGNHSTTQVLHKRDFLDLKKVKHSTIVEGDPLESLRSIMKHFDFRGTSPVPFCGGMSGYFSYDFGVRLNGLRQKTMDDQKVQDFIFGLYDKVIAFDHDNGEIYFLALDETDLKAKRKIDEIKNDLGKAVQFVSVGETGKLFSNLGIEQYAEKIDDIKKYLTEGETYQVNFSQRFQVACTLDSWTLYKKLRTVNPAPYSCFFDFPDFKILSSSPELLVSKRGKNLVTKPIKGTIARGLNQEEDKKNIQKLLDSEKDKAELMMIVDLERNDLGKVSEAGSVEVTKQREIEQYAKVIHTVSTIQSKLGYGKDLFDVIGAMFPGGSITGCPKIRTMEIIDKLEEFRRGIYCGSAGFYGFNGEADFNIMIRTMMHKNGQILFSAGGGIVIDSDAKSEYDESLKKAEALKEVF